ncbi:MAG TPA: ATP-dependent Clp protease proteolytic subunit, partial [Anaerolineaceae bacterium]|nr:ATP-dependent Clp protease proteolytic subunit [Anaerolineaceae bacterium]
MLRKFMRIGWLFVALALFITPAAAAGQAGPGQKAVLLQAEGPLTSSMVNYIDRGISRAEADRAALVILQLDTPGGEIGQMQEIIQRIRRSQVPVVVYVGPPGAMAASAGTLITLAGHASAMAPETMIGAASPVGGSGEDIGETMASKV